MKETTIYKIAKIVADKYEVSIEFIFQNSKRQEVADIRAVFHYMCMKHTNTKLRIIGDFSTKMGRKRAHHHAAILHSKKKVKNLIFSDKKFEKIVEDIDMEIVKQISYDKYISAQSAQYISKVLDKIFYEKNCEYLEQLTNLISEVYEYKNIEDLKNLIENQKQTNERVHKVAQEHSRLGMV